MNVFDQELIATPSTWKIEVSEQMYCYLGFGCKTSHQSSCSIASIVFLNETDG